ncbi:MAG: Ig-like domain-containing protein [Candidatus Symbiothrix sp.]|jgi:hypothetical protein|nr:Ig-like domain-containing protein [Candidatus Symbiothrix sp.]
MKQKLVSLMLTLIVMSAASVNAQVRIGGIDDPNPSAILDLNATDTTTVGKLGLSLPRVNLGSTTAQLNGANPLNGTMVYNTNASMTNGQGAGIYFWNSGKWNALAPVVPVTGLTITGDTLVGRNENLQLEVTIAPVTASNQRIVWSSSNTSIATVDPRGLVRGIGVGSATITAASQDGSGTSSTKKVNVFAGMGYAVVAGQSSQIYTYPDTTIGTWMIAPLSTTAADTLVGTTAYYSITSAANACSIGWALPTVAQASSLGSYVNRYPSSTGSQCWTSSPYKYGFIWSVTLAYTGSESRFWIAGDDGQQILATDRIYIMPFDNPKLVSVRCRRI